MRNFTIQELAAAVDMALHGAEHYEQSSKRVREVPNPRTIRYYTTIGLVDRPAEMKGRTAYYQSRHVLQLVAIKRLQSEGRSLVEIQAQLTGVPDAVLAAIAELPRDFWNRLEQSLEVQPSPPEPPKPPLPRDANFWAQVPETNSVSETQPSWTLQSSTQIPIAENVQLVFHGLDPEELSPEQLNVLAPVLNELQQTLQQLGLTQGEQQR